MLVNWCLKKNLTGYLISFVPAYVLKISLQMFLDRGLDLNSRNDEEETLAHVAASMGRNEIIREIGDQHSWLFWMKDDHHRSPLHLAAREGHYLTIQELLAVGSSTSER